jgi:predicted transcriptional regulator
MSRQLTIRNVPDEVGKRLDRLSRERGESLNTLLVQILTESVGVDARRARLARYATWDEGEAAAFDEAIAGQRQIDADLWR